MLSPKTDLVRVSKSVTNTPFRRAASDPLRQQLGFHVPSSAPPTPHTPHTLTLTLPPTISESPEAQRKRVDNGSSSPGTPPKRGMPFSRSVGVNTDISGEILDSHTEFNIEAALTDEIKLMQVRCSCLKTGKRSSNSLAISRHLSASLTHNVHKLVTLWGVALVWSHTYLYSVT